MCVKMKVKDVTGNNLGIGTITSIGTSYITVDFDDEVKQIPFDKVLERVEAVDPNDQVALKTSINGLINKGVNQTSRLVSHSVNIKRSIGSINGLTGLSRKNPYGTVAKGIYEICVKEFDFDAKSSGKFAKQKELYAENASKEGYSVWMIANSNLTGTKNGRWRNEILNDYNLIKEHWDDVTLPRFEQDKSNRIVFYKDLNGVYYFLGVYEFKEIDTKNRYKSYECISETYR